jgi:alpha-beta hydrolase superfamily lysophospholipase
LQKALGDEKDRVKLPKRAHDVAMQQLTSCRGARKSLASLLVVFSMGCPDASTAHDAGQVDTSSVLHDAHASDDADQDASLATEDAPMSTGDFRHACMDAPESVFHPTVTGALTMERRGEILACATIATLSQADAQTYINNLGVPGAMPFQSVRVLRVAYATMRNDTQGGVGTALVFAPLFDVNAPSAIVVAAHGTLGAADVCAPSAITDLNVYALASDRLALAPLAAGLPVIAPDYAGLGTDGIAGTFDGRDTGYSTLDASRALDALLPDARTDGRVFMIGHSQGGGAVLAAQALERTYGAGGDLQDVVASAPGWPVTPSISLFQAPWLSTGYGSLYALAVHAYFANYEGLERAGDGFNATRRDAILDILNTQCVYPGVGSASSLITTIPAVAPTLGDLFDETFRAGVVSCGTGGACEGAAARFYAFLQANVLTVDPAGASITLLQGQSDVVVPAATTACTVQKLMRDGMVPTVCVDTSDHSTSVASNLAFLRSWFEARARGMSPPACRLPLVLPACFGT